MSHEICCEYNASLLKNINIKTNKALSCNIRHCLLKNKKTIIMIAGNFNPSINTYGSLVYAMVRKINAWYKIKVRLVICIIHDLWTRVIFFCHISLHTIIVVLHMEKNVWFSNNKKRRFYRLLPIYETSENEMFYLFIYFF